MTTPTFDAILFDLDGTLLDRNAVFVNVARDFYDAYLHNRAHHTRDKAVAMMVEWDGEGYTDRQNGCAPNGSSTGLTPAWTCSLWRPGTAPQWSETSSRTPKSSNS